MTGPLLPDGFDYQGDVYRPPGEAHNILIQATVGCSHGKCTFCAGHTGKRFAVKPRDVLERDLLFAKRYCTRQDRVFIIDGNALCMPMPGWEWLLEAIRADLPWVRGVGCFGTAMDVAAKSDDELRRLREGGLDRLYLGVESGSPEVLRRVRKGVGPEALLAQCRRVKAAGMELQVSMIIGIVDAKDSLAHARATGALLSGIDPDVVTVLTLVPQPGTPMRAELERGEFSPPDERGLLAELRELLLHTNLQGGLFDCGHSSGYLSFTARLPEQKEAGLQHVEAAMAGLVPVKDNARRRI